MFKVTDSFQSAFEKSIEARKPTNDYNKIGIECEVCEKIFFKTFAFTVHDCQDVLKNLKCAVCLKTFPSRTRLSRHSRVHSGNNRLFECAICKRRFTQKISFLRHNRSFHAEVRVNSSSSLLTKEKSLKCGLCGTLFRSMANLRVHLAGHKPHRCRVCYRGFSLKSNLKRHMTTHFHRTYECETCRKSFLWKTRFKKHMELVHKENCVPKQNLNRGLRSKQNPRGGGVDSRSKQNLKKKNLKKDTLSKTKFKENRLSKENIKRREQTMFLQCQTCSRLIIYRSQLKRHCKIHPNLVCLVCKENYMNCQCSEDDHFDNSQVSKTKVTYSRSKPVQEAYITVQRPGIVANFITKIEEEPTEINKIDLFNELNNFSDKKVFDIKADEEIVLKSELHIKTEDDIDDDLYKSMGEWEQQLIKEEII